MPVIMHMNLINITLIKTNLTQKVYSMISFFTIKTIELGGA